MKRKNKIRVIPLILGMLLILSACGENPAQRTETAPATELETAAPSQTGRQETAAPTTAVPTTPVAAAATEAPTTAAPTTAAPAETVPPETGRVPEETLPEKGVVTDGKGWYLWDENNRITQSGRDDIGEVGMVSTAKYEASAAGMEIIELGGNAIDAAVAAAFALSVVEPNSSGLGGGGNMLIYTADGQAHFLDFRGTAPAAATLGKWAGAATGALSVTVPLEVEGLWTAFTRYGSGRVSWEQVLAPAIRLAEDGFYVTPTLREDMRASFTSLYRDKGLKELYLNNGVLYWVGDRFTNKPLAQTLRMIAEGGPDVFYTGPIAEAIIETMDGYGGLMTLEDLANRKVRELEVVKGNYRGYTILATPFGGASVTEAMNILENFDLKEMGFGSAQLLNLYGEAFQMVFRDRFDYLGDPDYADIPLENLLSKAFAKARAAQIHLGTTEQAVKLRVHEYSDAGESQDTTHFSVADAEGNMVACTQTINGIFGAKIAVGQYGIVLNNIMNAFSTNPNSNNRCEPGKTPNSNMSPTIVLDPEGKPFMVLGSPGSRKIITSVAQILVNVIDFGMGLQEAVDQPRMFNDTTRKYAFENRFDESVITALKEMGYDLHPSGPFDTIFGSVQAILYKDGVIYGAADPRRDGKAIGY